MGGTPRASRRSPSMGTQMSPRPYMAMNVMSSAVTFSAAITRSPSFSRSASSTTTTIRPSRMARTASSTEANSRASLMAHQFLHVLGDDVDFEVDGVSDGPAAERGDGGCVRDQGDGEGQVVDVGDGERHAVDRDG